MPHRMQKKSARYTHIKHLIFASSSSTTVYKCFCPSRTLLQIKHSLRRTLRGWTSMSYARLVATRVWYFVLFIAFFHFIRYFNCRHCMARDIFHRSNCWCKFSLHLLTNDYVWIHFWFHHNHIPNVQFHFWSHFDCIIKCYDARDSVASARFFMSIMGISK